MASTLLDLTILEQPLEPIVLHRPASWFGGKPRKREAAVRHMDAGAYALYQEGLAKPDDLDVTKRLVKRLVPSITEAEFALLTPGQIGLILLHAQAMLQKVIKALDDLGKAGATPPRDTASPSPEAAPATP